MSKLMWIAGILLMAFGVALGLMVFASPASVVGWGITPDVAAVLLVGGFISVGLGGVINALETLASARMDVEAYPPQPRAPAAAIPEFGRKSAETAAAAAATAEEVSEPVKETIAALEQARQNIEQAFEPPQENRVFLRRAPEPPPGPESAPQPAPAPVIEPEPAPSIAETPPEQHAAEPEPETGPEMEVGEEAMDEGQLYVVEERFIRERPARILSDGTVEAETDEGWMRFENLEHLDEYLDAMAPPA